MKTVIVKCTLEEANFIVQNIIPIDKSTRDLEIEIAVEIDDTSSEPFKFLSSRKDIVKDWYFEGEKIEVDGPVDDCSVIPSIENEIDVEEENKQRDTRDIVADGIIINTPFELDKFIITFCKIFTDTPALLPFTNTWETKYLHLLSELNFTYSESNLKKCKAILEIWDKSEHPLKEIGTKIRKWISSKAGYPSVSDKETYVIDQLLKYLEK